MGWCIGLVAWYTAPNATFCLILTIISKYISIAGIQRWFQAIFVVNWGVGVAICRWTDCNLRNRCICRTFANRIGSSVFIVRNAGGTDVWLIRAVTAASTILIWTSLFIGIPNVTTRIWFFRWFSWTIHFFSYNKSNVKIRYRKQKKNNERIA